MAIERFFQNGGRPPFWILLSADWDHPRRLLDGLYRFAKFG